MEVKRAIPKGQINHTNNQKQFLRQSSMSSMNNNREINNGNGNPKKIFIGGLPDNLTQLELRSFFEKFGSVVDSVIMYDNMTQRPRGFGFITFSSDDPVTMVLKNSFYQLKGKLVQVKLAVPKDDNYRMYKNDNEHSSPRAVATDGRAEPNYGIYQHTFYPRFGDYGYFHYYVAAPCPPYLYGGLYGGCSPSGVLGIGYNDHLGNSRSPLNVGSGVMLPVTYPPHVTDGFRSNMFVPTLCYAGDHGPESSKETSCRETEVILHIDQR